MTYCVWHDTKTVVLASTAYPWHSKETVQRRMKDPATNQSTVMSVPCPDMLIKYNKSMEGVDKSDQFISYHKVTRKTAKYWKTCFYHLIDVAIVNSHILYNWIQSENDGRVLTENEFRDQFILEIISKYGIERRPIEKSPQRPKRSVSAAIRISHGSKLYPSNKKSHCVYCYLHHTKSYTQRKCPDCLLMPALCQINEKDCHSACNFSIIRKLWYDKQSRKQLSNTTTVSTSIKSRGRPKGSINCRHRRGSHHKSIAPNS